MLLHAKIYWPEEITTRLWTCALKDFSGKLNKIKVNYDEITPMENLSVITTYITLKKTTHGAVKFMSWIQYFNTIYLDYPSGKPACMQGYIFITNHFIQYQ